jgi:hypothetical protein
MPLLTGCPIPSAAAWLLERRVVPLSHVVRHARQFELGSLYRVVRPGRSPAWRPMLAASATVDSPAADHPSAAAGQPLSLDLIQWPEGTRPKREKSLSKSMLARLKASSTFSWGLLKKREGIGLWHATNINLV